VIRAEQRPGAGDGTADRYARQRLIPGWDQDRLAAATVVIMGVGALGNEVAKNLALAGAGRMILCDPDTVSASNLSRTVLFGPADLARPKADAAAGALRALVPGLVAEARVADLGAAAGLGELADSAVVLSCVDTIRARMRLLGRCALAGAALVDGGTRPWGGEVRVRLSPDEPCYGCTLSAHERGVGDLPWSCFAISPDGPQPASIAATALVASWMSLAALQVIAGTPPGYRMLHVNAAGGQTAPVAIERDRDCPYHEALNGTVIATPLTNKATVAEFLAPLAPDDEPVTWDQFTIGWRCTGCRRYAAIGEQGRGTGPSEIRCGQCGGLLRERFSQWLRDASPQSRLAGLGIGPEEILPIRTSGGEYTWRRLSR
jgi:molybdopterin-synthase adenylyltransferase